MNKTKAQLRHPDTQRFMRFTEAGYESFMKRKSDIEKKLDREVSESVALDILLTGNADKYRLR